MNASNIKSFELDCKVPISLFLFPNNKNRTPLLFFSHLFIKVIKKKGKANILGMCRLIGGKASPIEPYQVK